MFVDNNSLPAEQHKKARYTYIRNLHIHFFYNQIAAVNISEVNHLCTDYLFRDFPPMADFLAQFKASTDMCNASLPAKKCWRCKFKWIDRYCWNCFVLEHLSVFSSIYSISAFCNLFLWKLSYHVIGHSFIKRLEFAHISVSTVTSGPSVSVLARNSSCFGISLLVLVYKTNVTFVSPTVCFTCFLSLLPTHRIDDPVWWSNEDNNYNKKQKKRRRNK